LTLTIPPDQSRRTVPLSATVAPDPIVSVPGAGPCAKSPATPRSPETFQIDPLPVTVALAGEFAPTVALEFDTAPPDETVKVPGPASPTSS
jgi:hypothetical protein